MPLVVVTRYIVPDHDIDAFAVQARDALDALRGRPGCRRGHLGRSIDEPSRWLLQTEWDGVGDYRRALSHHDVKVRAVPVMYHAVDEPTAFEVLAEAGPDRLLQHASDRDPGAATTSLGRRDGR
ncbi:MAG: antibiotic biosynthesis monooxygenase family protein [Angustibacter sp.]